MKGYIYRWLKQQGFPTGFRVLCMNCNFSYGLHGYCPHVHAISTLEKSCTRVGAESS